MITRQEKIKLIHTSDLFGVVIECGCGATIANSLFEIDGASKTIFYASQPYSKNYQNRKYPNPNGYRSVSSEYLYEITKRESDKIRDLSSDSEVNFSLTTTFQIQGKENQLTHGWIGFHEINKHDGFMDRVYTFYHISIPSKNTDQFVSRTIFFEIISEIAIDLLYSKIDSSFEFYSRYIDNIATIKGRNGIDEDEDKLLLFKNLKSLVGRQEGFLYINHLSKVLRFEDFCRDKEGIILIKGSFNPLHHRHIELLEETRKLYPNYHSAFFISIGNRDKNDVNENELLQRIKNINQHGYNVVLCRQQMFIDNVNWIRDRYALPIILPVGYDTINRFVDDCLGSNFNYLNGDFVYNLFCPIFGNTKFLVFHRKGYELNENAKYFLDIIQIEETHLDDSGVSSTKIRNGEIENKI